MRKKLFKKLSVVVPIERPIQVLRLTTKVRKGFFTHRFLFFLVCMFIIPPVFAKSNILGTFRYALPIAPATLNPLTSHDNYSVDAMRWMVESLLERDKDTYEWVPQLALKYEVSKDGRDFTFFLRKGVKFHDGSEMTAEDVKFSYDVYGMKIYDLIVEAEDFKDFSNVEVIDPYTVRFHAKNNKFSLLQKIATLPILPKAIYGDRSQVKSLNKRVIGTGPYRFDRLDQGQGLFLKANPEWWGRPLPENAHKYNFDTITVRFISDSNIAQLMLEKGELDYLGIRPEMISKRIHEAPWGQSVLLEENRSLAVATTQNSFFLNLRLPIFQDLDVRRALQMLLNRDAINKTMLEGKSLLATGPWHRLNDSADPSVPAIGYQPKEAARLLAKAGWQDTDQDGVLDKMINGERVPFRFTIMIPRAIWERYLVYYQSDLKKAGIQLEIKLVDWSLFSKNMDDLNFESYVIGRGYPGQIDFDPEAEWHSRHRAKLDGNNIGYANPAVDQLLEQIQLENNRSKRLELLHKTYRLISEDQSQIFWFSDPVQYYGRSSRLRIPKPSYKYRIGWEYWSLN